MITTAISVESNWTVQLTYSYILNGTYYATAASHSLRPAFSHCAEFEEADGGRETVTLRLLRFINLILPSTS